MTLTRLAVVALMTLTGAGCATMNVSSQVERGVNFAQFRTWDWGQADALPAGDPRLDKDPFFADHLQGAIERSLAGHGLARANQGSKADLAVHYHANISQRFLVNEPDVNCVPGNCPPSVMNYEEGTLVIDVVDTKTEKVVWRGWAQDSVRSILEDQGQMADKVNEAVRKMMLRFPVRQ